MQNPATRSSPPARPPTFPSTDAAHGPTCVWVHFWSAWPWPRRRRLVPSPPLATHTHRVFVSLFLLFFFVFDLPSFFLSSPTLLPPLLIPDSSSAVGASLFLSKWLALLISVGGYGLRTRFTLLFINHPFPTDTPLVTSGIQFPLFSSTALLFFRFPFPAP